MLLLSAAVEGVGCARYTTGLINLHTQVFRIGPISCITYFLFSPIYFFHFPSDMSVIWVLDFLHQLPSNLLLSYFVLLSKRFDSIPSFNIAGKFLKFQLSYV